MKSTAVVLVLILNLFFISCSSEKIPVDVLIKGALVFNGENNAPEKLTVAITGDRISYIGSKVPELFDAKEVIEAEGMYLAPGMIDPHTHLAEELSDEEGRKNLAYLKQGVTTVFAGNDGNSPLPTGKKLANWEQKGIATNAGLFLGHGTVRTQVMGLEDLQPTDAQLQEMKSLVQQAMDEGAFGLSTGLFYAPANFAKSEEVIALAQVAADNGGIYDTHMRDESSYSIGLLNAVDEVLEIARKTGIPVHISHIKALGTDVWGKSTEVISKVEDALAEGLQVTANQYPYLASKTSFRAAVIPRWAEDGGNEAMIERFTDKNLLDKLRSEITENIRKRGGAETLVFSKPLNEKWNGMNLKEYAANLSLDHSDAAMEILKTDPNLGVVSFNMQKEDLLNFMKQPWVMTGSDGGSGHPRKFGSFAKKLSHYALKKQEISLQYAIHSATGLTAETLGIEKRGFLREGYYADLFLFDPKAYVDQATYEHPSLEATGVYFVMVNGVATIKEGEFTGVYPGRALRKNQH